MRIIQLSLLLKLINWQSKLCLFVFNLKVDYEMAMEYATQSGVSEEPRQSIYLQSLEAEDSFIDLHNPIFVFRLYN